MNILFLTPQLPYPPESGGTIKSWKLVEYLSNKYNLSLACFLKNEDKKYINEFSKKVSLNSFIYEEINIIRNIKSLFYSYLKRIPLSIYRNFSFKFRESCLKNINQYDIIIVDHFLMFQYIPTTFKGKVILHEHNAEYIMWEKQANIEKSFFKKIVIDLEAYRIKKYEKMICEKSSHILAAPNDIENLIKLGINKNKFTTTYHLGDEALLNANKIQFSDTKENLLYIGTLSWEANIIGLIWFIESIWPLVKKENKSITLHIVGKNPDQRIIDIAKDDKAIIFMGFVVDLEPLYAESRVFISPLKFGSGIKVKNINAMYRGIPLVTTSVGSEGINGENNIHFMVSNEESGFANKILNLIDNQSMWENIRDNSRTLMKEKYTWQIVYDSLDKVINS